MKPKKPVISRDELQKLMYGIGKVRRFTQDSPIMPDVWIAYGENPDAPQDLLLTPHNRSSAGELSRALRERLQEERKTALWQSLHGQATEPFESSYNIAYNQSTVAIRLYFDELIRVVLPMTRWWQDYVWKKGADAREQLLKNRESWPTFARALDDPEEASRDIAPEKRWSPDLFWMFIIVGTIAARQFGLPKTRKGGPRLSEVQAVARLMEDLVTVEVDEQDSAEEKEKKKRWSSSLWSVNRNREAETTVTRSSLAVKADAARRLFNVSCKGLAWAIIDSGIDARHPAFRVRKIEGGRSVACELPKTGDWSDQTRIRATYDFTGIRNLLNPSKLEPGNLPPELQKRMDSLSPDEAKKMTKILSDLRSALINGREIDWSLFEPVLKVPHDDSYEKVRAGEHGTHVAGILAADWRIGDEGRSEEEEEENLEGICPDIQLYDIRVLQDGTGGDEFAVIAALQFVRYLNAHKDYVVVHGANMSLSIRHDVSNFACGCTPVCEESERLVNAGIVVVAAAGNQGWHELQTSKGLREAYNSVSITDPGNAEGVITVGATHRYRPHTYGVSYFSSRGPTGDGRIKPDLVAPGEKIKAPVPGNDCRRKDGTSMAAPHVSGAAALLMARHDELIGKPQRVKKILCDTATDLGRERYFQGCGMVDILRALQSV